jgi:transposase InsO family protein
MSLTTSAHCSTLTSVGKVCHGAPACWDNAQAESLFSRYKAELLEDGLFADTAQAKSETFSYIEGYYNRVRRHSSLGYKTPEEFEREWHINTQKKGSNSERVMSGKT